MNGNCFTTESGFWLVDTTQVQTLRAIRVITN